MAYEAYGLTTLQEILDENVVYRNLVPADERLPALSDLQGSLGLEARIPRKAEPAYGRVVAEMLRRARATTCRACRSSGCSLSAIHS